MSCGEGGALIVNSPELVERAHFIQEKGTDRSLVLKGVRNKYSWVDLGSSFLLSDILAAMLLTQLEHTEKIIEKRSKVTAAYYKLYKKYEQAGFLQLPRIPEGVIINHHAFFVIFDTEINQQKFLDLLRENSIYAYIGYVPLHSSPMGRKIGYKPHKIPRTEDIAKRIVRLPLYTDLPEQGLDYCIKGMSNALMQIYHL
ncbi:MAG: hypothetical protein D3905_02915 [Candidatus Electrothrix sp. AS4_5]|nr:hypothetical protein [Candidatus Electrothrix gigas]